MVSSVNLFSLLERCPALKVLAISGAFLAVMPAQLDGTQLPLALEEYRCYTIFTGDLLPVTASRNSLRALTLHLPPWRPIKGGIDPTQIVPAAHTVAHQLYSLNINLHKPGAVLSLESACGLLQQCVALRKLELDFQILPISPETLALILGSLPHGGARIRTLSFVLVFSRYAVFILPRSVCQLLANEIYARCDHMRGLRELRILATAFDLERHGEAVERALEPFRQLSRMRRYVFSSVTAARRRGER